MSTGAFSGTFVSFHLGGILTLSLLLSDPSWPLPCSPRPLLGPSWPALGLLWTLSWRLLGLPVCFITALSARCLGLRLFLAPLSWPHLSPILGRLGLSWASWPDLSLNLALPWLKQAMSLWWPLKVTWLLASSWLHFGTILAHLSLILGLLAANWPYLGLIFAPSWLILVPSWVSWIYLGPILASTWPYLG